MRRRGDSSDQKSNNKGAGCRYRGAATSSLSSKSDKMSSTQKRWLAAICIVIALGLFLWSRVSRLNEEPLALETPRGTDFKVQNVPVRAVLVVEPIRVDLGGTISARLQLQNIADAPVLGNEMNGTLTAGLSAVGCQVATSGPMTYSTTAQVARCGRVRIAPRDARLAGSPRRC